MAEGSEQTTYLKLDGDNKSKQNHGQQSEKAQLIKSDGNDAVRGSALAIIVIIGLIIGTTVGVVDTHHAHHMRTVKPSPGEPAFLVLGRCQQLWTGSPLKFGEHYGVPQIILKGDCKLF